LNNLLKTALSDGAFVYTAELVLGRDHSVPDAEAFVRSAAQDARGIRIISITDLPGGNPALPPEGFIPFVLENGLTPIAHLTGKDGNRSFIESRLHELARLGAENVLALTGDAPRSGFQGRPKPVFDLDSVLILWLIRAMRAGIRYEAGRREVRSTPFDFYAGAVVNPFKRRQPDLMMQLYKLELKVLAGASFVISQIGYNLRKLYELRQYMVREGLGHIPVLANIYVPTATIARLMKDGEVPGCIVEDPLIRRLEGEKKPERLERAALMVAAVRDLGFAGAHIGGFGLTHADFLRIMDRSLEIGAGWKGRMEELVFEGDGDYYLFEAGTDGLSDGKSAYRQSVPPGHAVLKARLGEWVHRLMIAPDSIGERFFLKVLKKHESNGSGWRSGFWYRALGLSTVYRKAALGCVSCGDCVQDHLGYAGCSMRWCYKNLRNGPCGGSRPDGACEVDPAIPCVWNLVYLSTLRLKQDPRRFARTLIPPRDWCLDRTNALANRFAGIDNLCKRTGLDRKAGGEEKSDEP
jgi:methylenetetrahydrofolate reductase (NADPH)